MTASTDSKTSKPTRRVGHWIAGATSDSATDYLSRTSPRTGNLVSEVALGGAEDVNHAVRVASAAAQAWETRRPIERGRLLTAIAHIIRKNADHLVAVESSETGQTDAEVRSQIEGAAGFFEFYGGLVNAHNGEVIGLGSDYHSYTSRSPFGVVAIVTPWNAPLNQAARAIAPALATGNVVVVKPSEYTSSSAIELAKLASEAGLPDGVLNVVCGSGQAVGDALVRHPDVRKISFTGSLRTGQAIGRIAADRVVPCTLELGGKSANIVFDDADLDLAAVGSMVGFVGLAGQMCIAGSRILVQRNAYDKFLDKFVATVSQVRPGFELSPIVTPAQFTQVQNYFQTATDEGAVAQVGGRAATGEAVVGGQFVEPTVYTNVKPDMRIMREEIFGPVTAVMPFDDEDEAISLANDTEFGLYAGIWTTNVSRAHKIPRRLQAGTVTVNEYLMDHVETPFGGFKQSGIGREKGLEALHHYTQIKTVTIKL